ncbi:MAG: sigma 54-interacting transcriptional regulator [Gemmatimonadota bacterium]|nr:sigma 54-interacting transcriptional regulator [Gemmatimonadota bacterium]
MALSAEMLGLVLENLEPGVFTLDSEQRLSSWNRAAEKITGISASETIGRKCREVNCLNCRDKNGNESECPLFAEGEIKNIDCVIFRPDGTLVRILKNCRLIRDKNGRLLGGVGSFSDISGLYSELPPGVPSEKEDGETAPVPGMIGSSKAMRQVYRLTRFAADSESTALLSGESGTGKELLARAIHVLGRRREKPFVPVNSSALPESLLESELFGHVKGAFTGAVSDKVGRFELAGGGTIFLDEIGDISPMIQLKLLRFLQDREYQRVGESKSRKADVRVIAATNKDLFQEVRKGEFRDDLFFRLKVFPITLPPLRERQSDIPGLADYFIRLFNRKTGKNIVRIHPDAMKLLIEYCWPGNVRELEHAIEYAFVIARSDEISPFELPQEILYVEYRKKFCKQQSGGGDRIAGLPELSSRQPELGRTAAGGRSTRPGREELIQVLNQAGWNQTRAAKMLGVSRVTLWTWLKKKGITRPGG